MLLDIKRDCIIIKPENPMDEAFLTDTLGVKTGEELSIKKVIDVKLGFKDDSSWVLKIEKKQ